MPMLAATAPYASARINHAWSIGLGYRVCANHPKKPDGIRDAEVSFGKNNLRGVTQLEAGNCTPTTGTPITACFVLLLYLGRNYT